MRIFFQEFFQNFFKIFFSNFFFQIFLSKFSSKLFRDLFRGFRARHTRVASTPRGIFLVIILMQIFFSNFFFQIFFPIFFSKFFCQNFPQNCFGIYFEGFARHTRVASTTRGIFCEHHARIFSKFFSNS